MDAGSSSGSHLPPPLVTGAPAASEIELVYERPPTRSVSLSVRVRDWKYFFSIDTWS